MVQVTKSESNTTRHPLLKPNVRIPRTLVTKSLVILVVGSDIVSDEQTHRRDAICRTTLRPPRPPDSVTSLEVGRCGGYDDDDVDAWLGRRLCCGEKKKGEVKKSCI